jgi:hypothetical protein
MEYTQEQIDQMLADAKKGLFTEDDLTKRVTAEVDRRVETGIQKGIETQRSKWEEEYSKKAQMTAEELAKKELEELSKGISEKERDIKKRSNLLDAKDMLSSANIPKAHYEKFVNMLVSDDDETTKGNVTNFIEMFNKTKNELETELKTQMSNVPPPQTGNSDVPVTKEIFDKMTYSKKMDFKKDNPTKFEEFTKQRR